SPCLTDPALNAMSHLTTSPLGDVTYHLFRCTLVMSSSARSSSLESAPWLGSVTAPPSATSASVTLGPGLPLELRSSGGVRRRHGSGRPRPPDGCSISSNDPPRSRCPWPLCRRDSIPPTGGCPIGASSSGINPEARSCPGTGSAGSRIASTTFRPSRQPRPTVARLPYRVG